MKLAVIGKDVSQSDSPAIHKFLLGKMGVACTYDSVSVPPAEFSARAEGLLREYDALNVTIPFKGAIVPYLKELRGDALKLGAVNTVLTAERVGYNTDGYGFVTMLENEGVTLAGKTALVLGVGGAGRSCARKLAEGGARVSAYEQDEERLSSAYRAVGGFDPLTEVPIAPYDILVNCTGVGMHDTVGKLPLVRRFGGGMETAEALISLAGVAVDLIYVPEQSEFLRVAETYNKQTVNGAAMLFYQAYLADCIYTGRTPRAEEAKIYWNEFRRIR